MQMVYTEFFEIFYFYPTSFPDLFPLSSRERGKSLGTRTFTKFINDNIHLLLYSEFSKMDS